MERPYELDQRAVQKPGTMQCWWLSLLEIARDTKKLDTTFGNKESKLYAYFTASGRPIPEQGDLPAGAKPKNPELEVYGPMWQRMIMYFLWDKNNKCPWYVCSVTVPTSKRVEELTKLLGYLDVAGITFGSPRNLIPSNVSQVVNGLSNSQRVLLDKPSHAMSGIAEVGLEVPKTKIKVFNQETKITFQCWVQTDPKDKTLKLLSGSLKTQINWILPVET